MPNTKSYKTHLIFPDTHFTYKDAEEGGHDEKAYRVALSLLEASRPDGFWWIGDVGEWWSICRHLPKAELHPKVAIPRFNRELPAVLRQMSRAESILPPRTKRYFIQGNHEKWIDDYGAKFERPDMHTRHCLELDRRGYNYAPYGKHVRLGKLYLYHGGHRGGVYHPRQHLLDVGTSIMYGHTHDQMTMRINTLKGQRAAWSIGCLCKLDKKFLKGRPTNWAHNVAFVHVRKSGDFHVEIVDIINGKAIYGGKEF